MADTIRPIVKSSHYFTVGRGLDPAEKMAQGVCRAPVPHPPTLTGVFKKKRRRQSGFQHLRSPKVLKGGACRQAENRSMNTGSEGTPKSPKAFWGGGAATEQLSAFRKAKHRKSGVCRDEPPSVSKKHSPTAEIKISHNFLFSFEQNVFNPSTANAVPLP